LVKAHPVHVSICNLEIEQERITIAVKLFKDDFQLALQHNYGNIIETDDLTAPVYKNLLDKYINDALLIVMNKRDSVRFTYNKTEMNEEAIWLYYSTEYKNLKKLMIRNALLLDIYLDQTNLVIINHKGKQNGYRFNYKHFEQIIELK